MQLEEEDKRKRSDNIYTKTFKSENGNNETCIHNRTNIYNTSLMKNNKESFPFIKRQKKLFKTLVKNLKMQSKRFLGFRKIAR